MKKSIYIVIIALIVVGTGFFLLRQNKAPTDQDQTPIISQDRESSDNTMSRIFKLELQDYNGKLVPLADFKGKPLVINSWAAWCPFCKKELPDFVTAQKEFGDKVVIIAIDRAESLGVTKGYTDQQGTTNDLIFLLDPSDSFYRSIGGFSMPETIFVDKNGNIVDHKRGPMDVNEMRERIKKIL